MKFFYSLDENNNVCAEQWWDEYTIPEKNWKIADIEGAIFTTNLIPLYKEINGEIIHRNENEVYSDVLATLPPPTEKEILKANVDFLTMENEAFEEQNEQQQADIDYLLMLMEEE